ncbi:MAG: hypothetical protein LBK26_00985 [Rickettsiales bacterium]|jgi:hypothetical protein|nr:hypothetical protein [Rickettsiales bacterium]
MPTKKRDINESELDLPLSCSLFLEPALEKYKNHLAPVPDDVIRFLHEWNMALIGIIMQTSEIFTALGSIGKYIVKCCAKDPKFAKNCVARGCTVPVHSFHYAVRFSEGYNFATDKLNNCKDNAQKVVFADFGAGLSPLAPMLGKMFDFIESYAIELPTVSKLLHATAKKMGMDGKFQIKNDISEVTPSAGPSIATSLGVFPHLMRTDQLKLLTLINKQFQHFYIEMEMHDGENSLSRKSFDKKTLEDIGININTFYKFISVGLENKRKYNRQISESKTPFKGIVSEKLWFISR